MESPFKEVMQQIRAGSDPVSVLDVYLRRCSSDPSTPEYLRTEVTVVNGDVVFTIVGVLPSSLRELAEMFEAYANEVVADATF